MSKNTRNAALLNKSKSTGGPASSTQRTQHAKIRDVMEKLVDKCNVNAVIIYYFPNKERPTMFSEGYGDLGKAFERSEAMKLAKTSFLAMCDADHAKRHPQPANNAAAACIDGATGPGSFNSQSTLPDASADTAERDGDLGSQHPPSNPSTVPRKRREKVQVCGGAENLRPRSRMGVIGTGGPSAASTRIESPLPPYSRPTSVNCNIQTDGLIAPSSLKQTQSAPSHPGEIQIGNIAPSVNNVSAEHRVINPNENPLDITGNQAVGVENATRKGSGALGHSENSFKPDFTKERPPSNPGVVNALRNIFPAGYPAQMRPLVSVPLMKAGAPNPRNPGAVTKILNTVTPISSTVPIRPQSPGIHLAQLVPSGRILQAPGVTNKPIALSSGIPILPGNGGIPVVKILRKNADTSHGTQILPSSALYQQTLSPRIIPIQPGTAGIPVMQIMPKNSLSTRNAIGGTDVLIRPKYPQSAIPLAPGTAGIPVMQIKRASGVSNKQSTASKIQTRPENPGIPTQVNRIIEKSLGIPNSAVPSVLNLPNSSQVHPLKKDH